MTAVKQPDPELFFCAMGAFTERNFLFRQGARTGRQAGVSGGLTGELEALQERLKGWQKAADETDSP